MHPVFIYALNCPVTGALRYVGQTPNPDRRLCQHLKPVGKHHNACWVRSLLAKNLRPVMEILDVVPDAEADFWECEYIQNFRERGFDLTNFSDGGKATMRGKKQSPEACAKKSATQKANPNSGTFKPGFAAWNKGITGEQSHSFGRKHSPEACAKISAARKGKKFTPEHCAKLSAARTGKKPSPETSAKRRGKTPWNKGMKNGKRE